MNSKEIHSVLGIIYQIIKLLIIRIIATKDFWIKYFRSRRRNNEKHEIFSLKHALKLHISQKYWKITFRNNELNIIATSKFMHHWNSNSPPNFLILFNFLALQIHRSTLRWIKVPESSILRIHFNPSLSRLQISLSTNSFPLDKPLSLHPAKWCQRPREGKDALSSRTRWKLDRVVQPRICNNYFLPQSVTKKLSAPINKY